MSFFIQVKQVFRWYIIVTKRFLDLVPLATVGLVVLALFSQFFLLLSTLMPLKVIMILASDQIPSFFPEVLQDIEIDIFIFFLAFLTVFFYIVHLTLDWSIGSIAKKSSLQILENNKKVILFENQDIYAKNVYQKHIESLSDFIFVFVSLLAIGIFYPLVTIIVVASIVLVLFIIEGIYRVEEYYKILIEKYTELIKLLYGTLFLIIFVSILIDMLVAENYVNKLIVIVTILLIRQVLSKFSSAIKILISLYKKRVDINSIFFYRHIKMNLDTTKNEIFWRLLKDKNKESLVEKILENDNQTLQKVFFYYADIKNIIFLIALTSNSRYLIKVFNTSVSSQAQHEASFLLQHNGEFSLVLLRASVVEECHCHLYKFPHFIPYETSDYKNKLLDIHCKMLFFDPKIKLLKQYERTHPFLYQRITKKIFYKLNLISNKENKYLIEKFEESFESILLRLKAMPKQILNPIMTQNTLLEYDDKFVLLHWGSWKIDTIGSYYPVNKVSKKKLESILSGSDIKPNDIIISSLMTQFETLYLRENFTSVFLVIRDILKCLEEDKER